MKITRTGNMIIISHEDEEGKVEMVFTDEYADGRVFKFTESEINNGVLEVMEGILRENGWLTEKEVEEEYIKKVVPEEFEYDSIDDLELVGGLDKEFDGLIKKGLLYWTKLNDNKWFKSTPKAMHIQSEIDRKGMEMIG